MRTFWTALGLSGLLIVAVTLALLGASAPASCAHADDGRKANLFVQSAKEYASILATDPSSTCAETGMKALCTQADGLSGRNLKREAHEVYAAMFEHESGFVIKAKERWPRRCAERGEDATTTDSTVTTSSVTTTVVVGSRGPQGPPGKNGLNGRNGRNGINGVHGQNGVNGSSGRNGINGQNGANGRNGANGQNGKAGPLQIVTCNGPKQCGFTG